MKVEYTLKFRDKLSILPANIKEKFYKQVAFLLRDLRYPSLRAKKYDEELGIWQARVDSNYRFYFLIINNAYFLIDIKSHPK